MKLKIYGSRLIAQDTEAQAFLCHTFHARWVIHQNNSHLSYFKLPAAVVEFLIMFLSVIIAVLKIFWGTVGKWSTTVDDRWNLSFDLTAGGLPACKYRRTLMNRSTFFSRADLQLYSQLELLTSISTTSFGTNLMSLWYLSFFKGRVAFDCEIYRHFRMRL